MRTTQKAFGTLINLMNGALIKLLDQLPIKIGQHFSSRNHPHGLNSNVFSRTKLQSLRITKDNIRIKNLQILPPLHNRLLNVNIFKKHPTTTDPIVKRVSCSATTAIFSIRYGNSGSIRPIKNPANMLFLLRCDKDCVDHWSLMINQHSNPDQATD